MSAISSSSTANRGSIRRKGRNKTMRNTGKVPFVLLTLLLMSFIVMSIASLPIPAQAQGKVAQEVLFEKDVELPNKNVHVKIRRVKFPVNFKTPEHTHEGPGPRYILKGKLEVIEGGVKGTFGPGEVFWESGIPMTAENAGDEEAELIIIELLPAK
jgi:quercetin dioxygenase-like cupin family protein